MFATPVWKTSVFYCCGWKGLEREAGVSQETAVCQTWPQATCCVPGTVLGTRTPHGPRLPCQTCILGSALGSVSC